MTKSEKKRFEEILNSKEFKKIPELTDAMSEKIQKMSSRFMFFTKRDAKHGTCENCLSDVEFDKNTKHGSKVTCPHCGKEMKIEIEINGLVGFQFISDENKVIHFEDMSRREQIKVLNAFANGYELFINALKEERK